MFAWNFAFDSLLFITTFEHPNHVYQKSVSTCEEMSICNETVERPLYDHYNKLTSNIYVSFISMY